MAMKKLAKLILLPISTLLLSSCALVKVSSNGEGQNNGGLSGNTTENDNQGSSSNQSENNNQSSNNENGNEEGNQSSNPENPSNNEQEQANNPIEDNNLKSYKRPNFDYVSKTNKEDFTYQDLFDLHNRVELKVTVSYEELQKIQEDNYRGPKPEIYRLASKVNIDITTRNNDTFSWELENVGLRQKGNTSREAIFDWGGGLNTHNHYKLSFDETFTDTEMYDSDFISTYGNPSYDSRDFLGLSGLDFKWNRNEDTTHIKEIYASYVFKNSYLLYQNVGLASIKFDVGGTIYDFGLCTLYEPTSKTFIKRSLSSEDEYLNMPNWKQESKGSYGISGKKYGDLYKVSYGSGSGSNEGGTLLSNSVTDNKVGVETDIYGNDRPAYERKTNTSENYDDILLKDMVNAVNNGAYNSIANKVDLEYFAKFMAISYFVGNPDDMRYNYNNYLIYIRRIDGKAIFIPIDSDRCFGIGHTWDKGVSFSANSDVTPLNRVDVNGNNNKNPLIIRTILSGNSNACQEEFKGYINSFKETAWVNNDTFKALYDIAYDTYSSFASFSLSGGSDNISFSDYISIKLQASKNLNVR